MLGLGLGFRSHFRRMRNPKKVAFRFQEGLRGQFTHGLCGCGFRVADLFHRSNPTC